MRTIHPKRFLINSRDMPYWALVSCIMGYLIIRAFSMQLVQDEITSFFFYTQTGRFLPYHSHEDACNHLLNSALTYLFCSVFGESPFMLRLPNLLFALVFFYYLKKIAGQVKNHMIFWALVISVLFSHYFIEFFAYSRGYGLSFALLFGSIWYQIKTFQTTSIKYLTLSLLFLIFAYLALLVMIVPAIALLLIFILFFIYEYRKKKETHKFLKPILILVLLGIIPLIYFSAFSFHLQHDGHLYYGAKTGFWEVTIRTILKYLLASDGKLAQSFALLYFVIACGLALYLGLLKYRAEIFFSNGLHLFILFLLIVIGFIALTWVFQVNYPKDRVGLFIYPVFLCAFFILIDRYMKFTKNKLMILCLVPFLYLPIHFFTHFNIRLSVTYINQELPYRFYETIQSESKRMGQPVTVGGNLVEHYTFSSYNYFNGGSMNPLQFINIKNNYFSDFLILTKSPDTLISKHYDSIGYARHSRLFLLKRNAPLRKSILDTISFETHGTTNTHCFDIFKGPIPTTDQGVLFVSILCSIQSSGKPFEAVFGFNIRNKKNEVLVYEQINLAILKKEWKGNPGNFNHQLYLFPVQPEAHQLSIYLWNRKKQTFSIDHGEVTIYEINEVSE